MLRIFNVSLSWVPEQSIKERGRICALGETAMPKQSTRAHNEKNFDVNAGFSHLRSRYWEPESPDGA